MLRHRKGFTLIELLVVIAIIAVLAAILFPVFAMARDSGKKTKCMSQGKQVGAALIAYMSEWNDTFPVQEFVDNYYGPGPLGGSNPEDLTEVDLRVLLQPYCKSMTIWNCPSFSYGYMVKMFPQAGPYLWSWDKHKGWPSWWYLCTGRAGWDPAGGLEGKKLSSIPWPTKKAAFWDVFMWPDYLPHMGGTNLVYVDGHTRWHKVTEGGSTLEGYRYPPHGH